MILQVFWAFFFADLLENLKLEKHIKYSAQSQYKPYPDLLMYLITSYFYHAGQ